jgi:hypothetical protein
MNRRWIWLPLLDPEERPFPITKSPQIRVTVFALIRHDEFDIERLQGHLIEGQRTFHIADSQNNVVEHSSNLPTPPFEEVISRRPRNRQPYDGFLKNPSRKDYGDSKPSRLPNELEWLGPSRFGFERAGTGFPDRTELFADQAGQFPDPAEIFPVKYWCLALSQRHNSPQFRQLWDSPQIGLVRPFA